MTARTRVVAVGPFVGPCVAVIIATLALSGCTFSIEKSSDKPTASTSASASSSSVAGSLDWKPCRGSFECATLEVPLDYGDTRGTKIRLALLKRPATDQSAKIGSLLVNPGGPGGSGVDFAQRASFTTAVSKHFDIIGFDPRGVGLSTALDCHSHLQDMYDADPTIEDAADKATYLRVSKEYVDECATKDTSLLPHMGTLNVARDMDRIRQALGEAELNYLGYSYGTSIGQMYAQLFPTKIRTMVLDGVVDTEETGLQAADEQAGGFYQALESYFADCTADSACVLGADPRAKLTELEAKAEQEPIPAAGQDRPAGPGVVQLAIGAALYSKDSWPVLSEAISRGLAGNGALLVQLADSYLDRAADGSYTNAFDVYFAVGCLDSAWPKDPQAVFDNAKATGQKYPLVGEGLVNDYVRCALWPVAPQPLPELTAAGSPPIVVVSTTRDPATPYESGVKVAKRLPQGVLISNDGDGHTVYGQGKACVDDAVDTYLVTGKAPQDGLSCA